MTSTSALTQAASAKIKISANIMPQITAEKLRKDNSAYTIAKKSIEYHLQNILQEAVVANGQGQTFIAYSVPRDEQFTESKVIEKNLYIQILVNLCDILSKERGFDVKVGQDRNMFQLIVRWFEGDVKIIQESKALLTRLDDYLLPELRAKITSTTAAPVTLSSSNSSSSAGLQDVIVAQLQKIQASAPPSLGAKQ